MADKPENQSELEALRREQALRSAKEAMRGMFSRDFGAGVGGVFIEDVKLPNVVDQGLPEDRMVDDRLNAIERQVGLTTSDIDQQTERLSTEIVTSTGPMLSGLDGLGTVITVNPTVLPTAPTSAQKTPSPPPVEPAPRENLRAEAQPSSPPEPSSVGTGPSPMPPVSREPDGGDDAQVAVQIETASPLEIDRSAGFEPPAEPRVSTPQEPDPPPPPETPGPSFVATDLNRPGSGKVATSAAEVADLREQQRIFRETIAGGVNQYGRRSMGGSDQPPRPPGGQGPLVGSPPDSRGSTSYEQASAEGIALVEALSESMDSIDTTATMFIELLQRFNMLLANMQNRINDLETALDSEGDDE